MDDSVETKEKAGHGYNINVFKHLFDHFTIYFNIKVECSTK